MWSPRSIFARGNNLRLVVKGGGHSYRHLERADSLMIWTASWTRSSLDDTFVAQGSESCAATAVTVEAGAIWMHVYDAVTTRCGRYVQGGGCGTVGVAGLVQSGGFGSFSKTTGWPRRASRRRSRNRRQRVRIANACKHADLFWALKGGGGGTFGVVTRLTLRTHKLPEFFGGVFATIRATNDVAFRRLIGDFVQFYARTHNAHWAKLSICARSARLKSACPSRGLRSRRPKLSGNDSSTRRGRSRRIFCSRSSRVLFRSRVGISGTGTFSAQTCRKRSCRTSGRGRRPTTCSGRHNLAEAGHVLYGFQSVWLPASLLESKSAGGAGRCVPCRAARIIRFEFHFEGLPAHRKRSSLRYETLRPTPTS